MLICHPIILFRNKRLSWKKVCQSAHVCVHYFFNIFYIPARVYLHRARTKKLFFVCVYFSLFFIFTIHWFNKTLVGFWRGVLHEHESEASSATSVVFHSYTYISPSSTIGGSTEVPRPAYFSAYGCVCVPPMKGIKWRTTWNKIIEKLMLLNNMLTA